ncbi:hypothetical protein DL770_000605 [Monosporascus sp. CRB-9-2]|nr:hypothetical protein DL770_000605 [Monosporascus sp. CRB-9-2]
MAFIETPDLIDRSSTITEPFWVVEKVEKKHHNDDSGVALPEYKLKGLRILNQNHATTISSNGKGADLHCSHGLGTSHGAVTNHEGPIEETEVSESDECAITRTPARVRQPPGFDHLGVRNLVSNPQDHTQSGCNELGPLTELRYLCLPGHPGCGGRRGKSFDAKNPRRPKQKTLKIQSCVDCVFVPYQTESYEEPDDWVLFDELHQVATF